MKPASLRVPSAAALAATLSLASISPAATWVGTTGLFGDGANWTPVGVPTATDAFINNNGTAQIVAGDNFTVTQIILGDTNNNSFITQDGGSIASNSWIVIGKGSNGIGTYNLSGGSLTHSGTNQSVFIGENSGSQGALNISGTGAFSTSRPMGLGKNTGSNGVVTISGGSLTVSNNNLSVGQNGGTGVLNISGGTVNRNSGGGDFIIGHRDATNGSNGTVNQTGGTVNANNWTMVGFGNGASSATANYNLSGGTFNQTNRLIIGRAATGTFTHTGGQLSINAVAGTGGSLIVGFGGGNGTFNMSGTAQTDLNGEMWVGQDSGSVGSFSLSAGTINVNNWVTAGRAGSTGTINITGGTFNKTGTGGNISIASGGGAAGTGTLNLSGGTLNSSTTVIVGEIGGGNGTFNISGSGVANLPILEIARAGTGTVNLNGGTTNVTQVLAGAGTDTLNFNGGTLRAASGSNPAFLSGTFSAVQIRNGGAILDTNGQNLSIGAALLHSAIGGDAAIDGGLTKNGAGTLTLSGTNTYTGPTTVNAGTLSLGASNILADVTDVTVNGGTFDLGANSETVGNLSVTSGSVSGGGTLATSSVTVSNSSGVVTVSPVLAGSGGLTKTGAGALHLGSANTYTGTTSLSGGSLVLGAAGAFAPDSSLSLNGGTLDLRNGTGSRTQNVADLGLAGGTLLLGLGGSTTDNLVASGVTSVSGVTTLTLFGSANSGVYNLISGTAALSGANFSLDTSNLVLGFTNYTGDVQGNSYQLTVVANPTPATAYWLGGVSGVWGDASLAPVSNWSTDEAGTVDANQVPGISSDVIFSALGAANSSTTLGTDFSLDSLTFSSGAAGVAGVHSLTLAGANPNGHSLEVQNGASATLAFTGGSVLAGSVAVQNGGTLTAGADTLGNASGDILVNGVLNLGGANTKGNLSGSGTIGGSSSLTVGTASDSTFAGSLTDTVALTKAGSGLLTLTGASTSTGTLSVSAGTLALGTGGSLAGPVAVSSGAVHAFSGTGSASLSHAISGAGSLLHNGSGTTTYTGTATHTGGTTVSAGTLANAGSLAGSAVTVTGGTFQNTTGSLATASDLNIANGAGLTGTLQIDGGTVTQTAGLIFAGRNGGNGTFNMSGGTVTTPGIRMAVDGTGSTATGSLTGGSLNNTGEFWIGNAAGNTGSFNISAGDLTVNNWVAIGRFGATGSLNLSGGTLTKTGGAGNYLIIGSLGGNGTLTQTGGALNTTAGGVRLGENNGATPALGALWAISGNSTAAITGEVNVAWRSSEAIWNVSDNASVNATGRLIVGGETNNAGANAGPVANGNPIGTVNISGGSVTFAGGDSRIGGDNSAVSAGAQGFVNVSGGTLNFGANVQVGAYGTGVMTVSGSGTVNSTAGFPVVGRYAGGNGTLTVNGGTFTQQGATNFLIVGEEGSGTLNLDSGLVDVQQLAVGHGATGSGTVNLNGGVLATSQFLKANAGSSAAVSLNGGTIRSKADSADLFSGFTSASLTVAAGGAGFDTNGFNVTVTQDLAGPGGLTKSGSGTLTLNGSNSYAGGTSLLGGTTKAGSATAFSTGSISVASDATLDLNGQSIANPIINNGGSIIGSSGSATIAQNGGNLSGSVGGTITATGSVGGNASITGTLKGNATTFTGAITFENGSIHAPGNSPGLQTFSSGVSYGDGSTLEIELLGDSLATRGLDFDAVDVTGGDLVIVNGAVLKLIDLGSTINYASSAWDNIRNFTIVDSSGGGTTTGDFTLDVSAAGTFASQGSWSLLTTPGVNGDTILTWTPVPEPSTYAALAGLAALGLALRRRRAKASGNIRS